MGTAVEFSVGKSFKNKFIKTLVTMVLPFIIDNWVGIMPEDYGWMINLSVGGAINMLLNYVKVNLENRKNAK